MIFLTHLMFALLLGVISLNNLTIQEPFSFMGMVLFSSLLPDIDIGTSILGKYIKPLNFFFSHRGFFHSIIFMIIISILVNIFLGAWCALAIIIGFTSHIILDSMTPMGVYAFWPSRMIIRGKFKTGGLFDMLLFISFTGLIFGLLYYYGISEIAQLFPLNKI